MKILKGLTFSNARLRTRGSYGVDGIASKNQVGLYHLLRPPVLLEYKCPGGKTSKCSQSSCKPFNSEEIQIDPGTEKQIHIVQLYQSIPL